MVDLTQLGDYNKRIDRSVEDQIVGKKSFWPLTAFGATRGYNQDDWRQPFCWEVGAERVRNR